jgi:protein TonB
LSVAPVGPGPTKIVEEDNQIYNTAGIEVKPEFPGGMAKFYKYVGDNYRVLKKKVLEEKFT